MSKLVYFLTHCGVKRQATQLFKKKFMKRSTVRFKINYMNKHHILNASKSNSRTNPVLTQVQKYIVKNRQLYTTCINKKITHSEIIKQTNAHAQLRTTTLHNKYKNPQNPQTTKKHLKMQIQNMLFTNNDNCFYNIISGPVNFLSNTPQLLLKAFSSTKKTAHEHSIVNDFFTQFEKKENKTQQKMRMLSTKLNKSI
jgi:hypothetical protein